MKNRIKVYADEHVSTAVVKGLRLRGIDVLTTKEADLRGAPDQTHLEFARTQQRVIFTQDEDFLRLHASGLEHHGIIYAHQRTSIGQVIRGIMLIHQLLKPSEMKNHIEFL